VGILTGGRAFEGLSAALERLGAALGALGLARIFRTLEIIEADLQLVPGVRQTLGLADDEATGITITVGRTALEGRGCLIGTLVFHGARAPIAALRSVVPETVSPAAQYSATGKPLALAGFAPEGSSVALLGVLDHIVAARLARAIRGIEALTVARTRQVSASVAQRLTALVVEIQPVASLTLLLRVVTAQAHVATVYAPSLAITVTDQLPALEAQILAVHLTEAGTVAELVIVDVVVTADAVPVSISVSVSASVSIAVSVSLAIPIPVSVSLAIPISVSLAISVSVSVSHAIPVPIAISPALPVTVPVSISDALTLGRVLDQIVDLSASRDGRDGREESDRCGPKEESRAAHGDSERVAASARDL
jgi:hypothetical protein